MTTNNETPDTGTNDVEALIAETVEELETQAAHGHSVARAAAIQSLQKTCWNARETIIALFAEYVRLTARIAELERKESFHLRDFGFVADQYQDADAECAALKKRIDELEGQVEQARIEERGFICSTARMFADQVQEISWRNSGADELRYFADHLDGTGNDAERPAYQTADDIRTQAAKAEREWMLERLRQQAGRERENEHPKLADAIDYMIDVLEEEFAADHIEANGRDENDGN